MRLIVALCVFFILGAFQATAQQPYFKSLPVAKKIDEIRIQRIAQDQYGFLWLGTNRGLRRFNGSTTTSTALPVTVDNDITAIHIKGNTLIAGTKKGALIVIDLLKNAAESFITVDDEITALTIDAQNKIWIATASSGVLYGEKNNLNRIDNQIGLPDNIIHDIEVVGNAVFAATDVGLIQWDDCTIPNKFVHYTTDNGLQDNLILTLTAMSNSEVFLGGQNGSMCAWNFFQKTVTNFPAFNTIPKGSVIKIILAANELFCFTDNNYVFTGNLVDQQFVQSTGESQLPFNNRTPFLDGIYDQEGNLIVCNKTNNLWIADSRFVFITDHEQHPLGNLRAITSDRKDNIWLSTPDGLFSHHFLFSHEQKLKSYLPKPKKNQDEIICLAESQDSALWFGMYGGGLGRIDPKTKKIKYFKEKDGLLNNNVLSLTADGNKLWVATLGGVCNVENISGEWVFWNEPKESGLSTYVYCVFKDSKKRIWFGSDGDGPIYKDISGKYHALMAQFPLVSKTILAIKEDSYGNIWFLTADQQLQCFRENRIEKREIVSDGDKPTLYAIENDDKGNILVFTSSGFAIVRADSPSFEFVATDEPIGADYLNVTTKDQHGNIWIGLQTSLIRFAQSDSASRHKPLARIENILVQLQPIDSTIHEFSADENHFTFQITGLWFKQPERVRYRYRLIGYDANWAVTKNNEIVFSKLDPGPYTFVLQASANEDFSDARECIYQFEINRPFWQTWWFVTLALLLVFTTVFLILRGREQQLQRRALLQKERIQGQFETLRNQINPHFLFNSFNTLISTISKDQDEAIDYVEHLSDYFRIILEQRDKEVITVREELELVDRYLFLQKKRFSENLIVEKYIPESAMDTLIPPMTLQLLVENAIKHNIISRLKPLKIELFVVEKTIMVTNTFQEKTQKEPSTGVGLNNILHRYKILFKKDVRVNKTEENFEVHLPLIQPTKE